MPPTKILFFLTQKMVMELKHGSSSTNETCLSSSEILTFWPSPPNPIILCQKFKLPLVPISSVLTKYLSLNINIYIMVSIFTILWVALKY